MDDDLISQMAQALADAYAGLSAGAHPDSVAFARERVRIAMAAADRAKDVAAGMVREPQRSVLEEAAEIIAGPRGDAYGPVERSFERIAATWAAVLGVPVTPRQVALCMIGLKIVRDANQSGRDNLVDVCGYAALAEHLS